MSRGPKSDLIPKSFTWPLPWAGSSSRDGVNRVNAKVPRGFDIQCCHPSTTFKVLQWVLGSDTVFAPKDLIVQERVVEKYTVEAHKERVDLLECTRSNRLHKTQLLLKLETQWLI